jgi:uncharacterized membrane protein
MPRLVGASIGPLMSLVLPVLIIGASRLDPRREHVERSQGAIGTIVVAVSALGLGVQWVVLNAATSPDQFLDGREILVLVGLLWVVLGNALTKARSNWFVGIRTPWTMQSEKVWHKTHRLAGWLFAGAGLVTVIVALAVPLTISIWLALPCLLAAGFVPIVYSYVVFRQLGEGEAAG